MLYNVIEVLNLNFAQQKTTSKLWRSWENWELVGSSSFTSSLGHWTANDLEGDKKLGNVWIDMRNTEDLQAFTTDFNVGFTDTFLRDVIIFSQGMAISTNPSLLEMMGFYGRTHKKLKGTKKNPGGGFSSYKV